MKLFVLRTKTEIYLINAFNTGDIDLSKIDNIISLHEIGVSRPTVPPGIVFSAENPVIKYSPFWS